MPSRGRRNADAAIAALQIRQITYPSPPRFIVDIADHELRGRTITSAEAEQFNLYFALQIVIGVAIHFNYFICPKQLQVRNHYLKSTFPQSVSG